jgi:prepilin-type N-terminal cleavage/methylation domain-containing protein
MQRCTQWRTQARARGLTLVELMVTIAILSLLTAAIGVAVFHHFRTAQVETATIACGRLRTSVQMYAVTHPDDTDCPTPTRLREARELDASMSLYDPWSTPYRIECEPDETVASSAGPDRAFGTDDDVRVPIPKRPASIATQR